MTAQTKQSLPRGNRRTCRTCDWYSEGESRVVEVDGVRIVIRFIGRKARRGRILIEAPAGAVFRGLAAGECESVDDAPPACAAASDAQVTNPGPSPDL